MANPDAEFSEGPSIFERIERLHGQQGESEGLQEEGDDTSPSRELSYLAKSIVTALEEGALDDNPRVALFFQELGAIEREVGQYEQIGEVMRPLLQVSAFTESFNVDWLTVA